MNHKINMKYFLCIVFLIYCANVFAEEIIIPSINIPERYIPAVKIKAKHIPAKTLSNGVVIPAIDIPAIDIPGYYLPAVNTTATTIVLPEYAKVSRALLDRYSNKNNYTIITSENLISTTISLASRNSQFKRVATWCDKHVLDYFSSFDLDKSGTLSWEELSYFQRKLYKSYSYFTNTYVLNPTEFFIEGGGDCDDWAEVTAQFCRYWGWDAYIACFFNKSEGHAICVVKGPVNPPKDYYYWSFSNNYTLEKEKVNSGRYVPVDYDYVGSFSNALKAGMKLEYLLNPDSALGETL